MDAVQKELQKQQEIYAKEVAEGFPNNAKRREETTLREKLRKAQEKIEALEKDKFELAVLVDSRALERLEMVRVLAPAASKDEAFERLLEECSRWRAESVRLSERLSDVEVNLGECVLRLIKERDEALRLRDAAFAVLAERLEAKKGENEANAAAQGEEIDERKNAA